MAENEDNKNQEENTKKFLVLNDPKEFIKLLKDLAGEDFEVTVDEDEKESEALHKKLTIQMNLLEMERRKLAVIYDMNDKIAGLLEQKVNDLGQYNNKYSLNDENIDLCNSILNDNLKDLSGWLKENKIKNILKIDKYKDEKD